jgi:hypothetical protein
MCNLAHPPEGCLENIPSNWHWDDRKTTWVAQVVLGNTFSLLELKNVHETLNRITPCHEHVLS